MLFSNGIILSETLFFILIQQIAIEIGFTLSMKLSSHHLFNPFFSTIKSWIRVISVVSITQSFVD